MCLLIGDIIDHRLHLRLAHRDGKIVILPLEPTRTEAMFVYPERHFALYHLADFGDDLVFPQGDKAMYMLVVSVDRLQENFFPATILRNVGENLRPY
jgi:hypothetical protein